MLEKLALRELRATGLDLARTGVGYEAAILDGSPLLTTESVVFLGDG
jgi:hypothetical protein